ncbi:ankyrin repeat domain-containing protein [Azospirillum canadense]|uniref:ankyrin repeat domain-containing protein n=1 Tax=Azospirillum canadense TaxID=403962 RepID=UPI0022270855|nr:ankyrin repeat domain-containing protein [Azospirillum canadense]MCW2237495.1 ankyrin repeat protein [Azospirillum canadense]
MDRTAPKATPSSTPSQAGRLRPDQMEVFDGLLLALLARKRLLLLVGDAGSGRAAVFRQLVEQVASDGALVLPVSASPGAEVEDLVGSAGDAVLPSDNGERDFDTLIEELEERLDLAGAGLLAVENAGVLTPPVLGDLIDLTRSETAGGRFLQVLLCGTPEMERSLARPGLAEAVRELGVIYRMTPGAGPSVTPSAQPMGTGPGAPAAMRPIGPPPQPPAQQAPQEPPREPARRELRAPAPAPERMIPERAADPRANDPRANDPRANDPRANDWPANDWDAPDGWTIPEAGSPLASDMPVAPPRRRHAALAGAAITTLILLGAAGAAVTLAVPGATPEKALDYARQGWTDLRAFVTEHVGNPLSDTSTATANRDGARDPDAVALARLQNPALAVPDSRAVPAKGAPPVRSDTPSAAVPPGAANGAGSQVAALDPAAIAPSQSAPPQVAKPELPPLAPTITAPRVLPAPGADPLSAEPPPAKPRADQGEGPTSGSATLPPLVDEGPSAAATQGAAPAPAAPLPTDGDAGLSQRVRGLVDQARRQIIAKRLTTPPGDNAYETVSRLREVAPTTPEIAELLGTMEETYRRWASMAERDNDFDEAKRFYERALIVAPSNGDLRERIKAASERRVSPATPAAPAAATAGAGTATATTVANQPPGLDNRDSALALLRRPDDLKRLLDGGADANKRVDNGKTLLMLASEQGLTDAVKVLVDHRARTELRTADGATAVMYAAWGGHEAVVQALAAAGAELDATNDDGKTALMAASARGHMGVVRALLDRGVAVDRVASHGWSALMYAANNGHDRVAKLLVERGANPFRMDTAGNSALTLGALQGHMQVVEALKPR